MQSEDPTGIPGTAQAPSAIKGGGGYQQKGKSSFFWCCNIKLRAFFPNKLYVPMTTVKIFQKYRKG